MSEHYFSEATTMVASLADRIEAILVAAIRQRGRAELLVSGGRTPADIYLALSDRDIPWQQVTVALVDERWVDTELPDSNERFLRRHLLINRAASAHFIGMKTPASSADLGLADIEKRYAVLSDTPDVCLLGMGADGHTASLFPGAQGLSHALRSDVGRCAAIVANPSDVVGHYRQRVTLTLGYLNAAAQQFLVISGPEKRAVYERARQGRDVATMPVRGVLHQGAEAEVYWSE